MAAGAGDDAAGIVGLVAKPQVPELHNPGPSQGQTLGGGGISKKQVRQMKGITICSVNITSSSKKAI
eukprot:977755-Karenia_brevis.AAC.1